MARKNIFMFFQEKILKTAGSVGGAFDMVKEIARLLVKKPDDPQNIFKQMVRVGVDSLPIVLLSSLFTGMVLALQSGVASTRVFDEAIFLGTLVSFAIVLELGPVLTAMVMAGRVGASITAEIGTMKVNEEIDALRTMGFNPVRFLVVPRLLALLIILPGLALIADLVGILGGFFLAVFNLNISFIRYFHQTAEAALLERSPATLRSTCPQGAPYARCDPTRHPQPQCHLGPILSSTNAPPQLETCEYRPRRPTCLKQGITSSAAQ